jgi:outer membrane murein-binding lipoprotein Lpp
MKEMGQIMLLGAAALAAVVLFPNVTTKVLDQLTTNLKVDRKALKDLHKPISI